MKFGSILANLFFLLLSVSTLLSAADITSITPSVSPSSGGTIVTIVGSGFTGTTAVNFGSTPAASFIVNSDNVITAVTPAHSPQVVAVTVIAPSGISPITPNSFYTFQGVTQLYVDNASSNDISVVNTTTDTVIATPAVGNTPVTVTTTADGTKTYVANYNDGTVSVIDNATNTVIATIPVGALPMSIAITPDGTKVYVVNMASGDVSVIDTTTNTIITTVMTGGINPTAIAITPDGTKAYVTNYGSDSVSVFDIATDTVIASPTVGDAPVVLVITPDGTKVYVANETSNNVSVIDTATDTVIATLTVGATPDAMAITPDGTKVYVANSGTDTVSVIDTATDTIIGLPITVQDGPRNIAITPDGTKAYVANFLLSASVSVIDIATDTVIATLGVGLQPLAIAITPDGTKAYVANEAQDFISVIDIATDTVGPPITVGQEPLSLAMSPDQAPLAKFTFIPGEAGSPTTFDASTSVSPIGTIVNYFWDFGDGVTLNTPFPTTSHTYASPGIYLVSLTVTNSAGTSTTQVFNPSFSSFSLTTTNTSTIIRNGGPTAIRTQAITILPPLPPTSGPVITGLNPNFGPTSGGTVVTIIGFNFTGATNVLFGSNPATSFVVSSDNLIIATAPPGFSGIVDVRVITPAGISPITPSDQYRYIDSIFPLPPRDLEARQIKNIFATQTDIINVLTWKAPINGAQPVAYQIFRNKKLTKLAATISANGPLRFKDHNRKKGHTYTYFIVTIDQEGNISTPTSIVIK